MQGEQLTLFDDFEIPKTLPCPFKGRRVCVTGTFAQGRQALRSMLLRMGATEVKYDKLQRNTHFLLVGDNPNAEAINYWQLYVHDGYNIKRLSAEDLMEIQGGHYTNYQMPEELTKELLLTREHLFWQAPEIDGLKNQRLPSPVSLHGNASIYGREIYVHTSILQAMPALGQLLGCLGAYANTEMDEMTDSILIPGSMPKAICHSIEEYYNASKATLFNIPFIILEDLITYIRERVTMFPDEAISQLLENLDKK